MNAHRLRRVAIAAIIAAVAVILIVALRSNGDDQPPVAEATVDHGAHGKVIDQAGNPVNGAVVRFSGPFNSGEARATEALTSEAGLYLVGLHADGEYDVLAMAEGFEMSLLSPRNMQVPAVEGLTGFPDIVLRRVGDPPVTTPGGNGFVYGQGVECTTEDATRVLMTHGIIHSASEIEKVFEDVMVGQGWSTFVRDGQTISMVPITYTNEPACHTILKDKHRADGLVHVFLQKKCGNVSSPPGVPIPQPTPSPAPPGKEVPTATATPRPGTSTPPVATNTTVVKTATPPATSTRPVSTATPPRQATQTPQPRPTQPVCPCPTPVTPEPTFDFNDDRPPDQPSDPPHTVVPPSEPPPPLPTVPPAVPTSVTR